MFAELADADAGAVMLLIATEAVDTVLALVLLVG